MRISAKGRYALASSIFLAQKLKSENHISIIHISDSLGISKIYLEQIFSLLKSRGLVHSIKGAQGGYALARMPSEISVYDILSAVETAMFDITEDTVKRDAPHIEQIMNTMIFTPLDEKIRDTLQTITVQELMTESEKLEDNEGLMFYI